MPTEKPRYTIVVDETLLKEIDDFRFENRYPSRSAATLDLIRFGITQVKKNRGSMNYIYPAVFYPEDGGRYSVIFPDLNGLATYGDNLADAFAMAQEACCQYLFTSLRDGDVLPAPSALDTLKKDNENAIVNMICVSLDEHVHS